MEKLGIAFASLGLSPNFWTILSLSTSVLAGVVYATAALAAALLPVAPQPSASLLLTNTTKFYWTYIFSIAGSIILLISGFFDIVDGSVARATKQSSKKGAFLDSSFDKISESIIFVGIAIGNLANPILCMIALSLSLLVSYVRARAESLGIELKGIGIGERAERLLIIAIIGMIPIVGGMQWAVIVVSVLAGITLIQRITITSKKLQ
jgi:archaetidylinositol phosphate synthase